jgi:hypothetical protein
LVDAMMSLTARMHEPRHKHRQKYTDTRTNTNTHTHLLESMLVEAMTPLTASCSFPPSEQNSFFAHTEPVSKGESGGGRKRVFVPARIHKQARHLILDHDEGSGGSFDRLPTLCL